MSDFAEKPILTWGGACAGKRFDVDISDGRCSPYCMSEVELPGLRLTEDAEKHLREPLSIPAPTPGLTPEQAEVARLEGELEQARADGLVLRVEYFSPSAFRQGYNSQVHSYTIYSPTDIPHIYEGSTKLEAARATASYVRYLHDAKPKLPEPEDMTCREKCAEMQARGWLLQIENESLVWRAPFGKPDLRQGVDSSPERFHGDSLRRARELDGV